MPQNELPAIPPPNPTDNNLRRVRSHAYATRLPVPGTKPATPHPGMLLRNRLGALRRYVQLHLDLVRVVRWIGVAAIVCAWLLPGTLGHDPWKQDETYTFGIIYHMLITGDFVVPINAGQPFMEKPPIYDWVGAASAWTLGRYLPLHDAARLASALFAGLALLCVARTARCAANALRWLDIRVIGTVALFAGTLVVVKHTHDMMTDVALMAGAALGFCGLFELVLANTTAPRQSVSSVDDVPAALRFGAGLGIALMAKGLFLPLVFGATACAVLAAYPACRSRRFVRSLGVAAIIAAPFAVIWPVCLFLRSEKLFMSWFWDNNVGRFFGFSVPQLGAENDKRFFIARVALSVGFPVVPLALISLGATFGRVRATRHWQALAEPRVALPAIFAAIGFGVLTVAATSREVYILPFIAPLSILAAQAVGRLPQRLHNVWDITSRVLFGSFGIVVWLCWSTMTGPVTSHDALHRLGRWLPLDWVMPVRPGLITAALALTLGWLWLLPRLHRTREWRGILSWTLGAIVAWGLVSTLLLPWLDYAKSYRSVFTDLGAHLSGEWNAGDCMASSYLGESEAPMLEYFTGIEHQPVEHTNATKCTWLIVESRRDHPKTPDGNWHLFWSGARPGDTEELLRVFIRMSTPANFLPAKK